MSLAAQLPLTGTCDQRVARSIHLEKIQFTQDFYAHFRNLRSSVQDLASLLAVLVWWDYDQFTAFQQQLADKMTQLCNPTDRRGNPKEYTKKQISDALKILSEQEYIIVPRRVDWKNKCAKTYTFTDKFKNLIRARREKMSHQHLHGHKNSDITRTREYSTNITLNNNSKELTNRALNINNNVDTKTARVDNKNKSVSKSRPRILPRVEPHRVKRTLSKAQRGVIHWLSSCSMIDSDIEVFGLTGVFLQNLNDDFIGQILSNWRDCTNAERSFHVRQLVPHLRKLRKLKIENAAITEPSDNCASSCGGGDVFNFGDAFNEALFFGVDYNGPGANFVDEFHEADDDKQTWMLQQLQAGKTKPWGF